MKADPDKADNRKEVLHVKCPSCGTSYKMDLSRLGRKVKCAVCNSRLYFERTAGGLTCQIEIKCPQCNSVQRADGSMLGKAISCPECQYLWRSQAARAKTSSSIKERPSSSVKKSGGGQTQVHKTAVKSPKDAPPADAKTLYGSLRSGTSFLPKTYSGVAICLEEKQLVISGGGLRKPVTAARKMVHQTKRGFRVQVSHYFHTLILDPDTAGELQLWLSARSAEEPEEKMQSKAKMSWSNLFAGFGATFFANLLIMSGVGKWPGIVLLLFGIYWYFSAPVYTILDFVWYSQTRERVFLVHGIWGAIANAIMWPILIIVNIYVITNS